MANLESQPQTDVNHSCSDTVLSVTSVQRTNMQDMLNVEVNYYDKLSTRSTVS